MIVIVLKLFRHMRGCRRELKEKNADLISLGTKEKKNLTQCGKVHRFCKYSKDLRRQIFFFFFLQLKLQYLSKGIFIRFQADGQWWRH